MVFEALAFCPGDRRAGRQGGWMALGRVGPAAARVPGARHTSVSPGGRHRWAGPGLLCPQEEESPCGEVTLRRDHSLSEHDLVQLRSEVAAGLQPATQPPGGLGPPRPRAGSACAWRPSTQEQGPFPVSIRAQPDPSSPQRSNLGSAEDRPDTHHLWLVGDVGIVAPGGRGGVSGRPVTLPRTGPAAGGVAGSADGTVRDTGLCC